MQRSYLAALLLALALPACATTYYVSPTGSDSNNGTSKTTPWATVAKVNTGCTGATFASGDNILFQLGSPNVWHEQLTCGNTNSTLSAPPNFAGVTIGVYGTGTGAILDAANPLGAVTWTQDAADDSSGKVYKVAIPSGFFTNPGFVPGQTAAVSRILKLYMDGATSDTIQVLPVTNYLGVYSGTPTTVNYLDTFNFSGNATCYSVSAAPTSHSYGATCNGGGDSLKFWADNFTSGAYSGISSMTNTGVQNVVAGFVPPTDITQNHQTYPGVWWSDGTTLYINLGGVNPNAHSFEGTVRLHGIQLENTNAITVSGLTVAHSYLSGISALPIATNSGTYTSTQQMDISGNYVFNWGGYLTVDSVNYSGNDRDTLIGGIILQYDGTNLIAGNQITENNVGTADLLFADYGGSAGIYSIGWTGGVVSDNYVKTQLAEGLDITAFSNTVATLNESTYNYGGMYFHNGYCGSTTYNYIHEHWAEGIQVGGGTANSSSCVETIGWNVIANGFENASGGAYNGIDCNGAALNAAFHFTHNTIANEWGAGITNESNNGSTTTGCQAATIDNNIIDMPHPYFPPGASGSCGTTNCSNGLYFAIAANTPTSAHNNVYILTSGATVAAGNGGFSNSTWLASHETNSTLTTGAPSSMWDNFAADDFRVASGSPAQGAGTSGAEPGAGAVLHRNLAGRFSGVRIGR